MSLRGVSGVPGPRAVGTMTRAYQECEDQAVVQNNHCFQSSQWQSRGPTALVRERRTDPGHTPSPGNGGWCGTHDLG